MRELRNAFKMLLWMVFLTGIAYPLIVTGIAQLLMHDRANGGLIVVKEKLIGAENIGQKFTSDKYFWGRPSAVEYNPLPSGGSNLGPTSTALKNTVETRKAALIKAVGTDANTHVPSELLFASGSGLDPHISPKSAIYQMDRVLKARHLDTPREKLQVMELIESMTEKPWFGNPVVNVLKLNLALDDQRS